MRTSLMLLVCDAVEPEIPQLSADTAEQDMREGGAVEFTCSSTGGNPAPNITWYRNGVAVTGSRSSVTPPSEKFGATVGTLTWTLTSDDHLANFSCSASSQLNPGSEVFSAVERYRVQCK